MNTRWIFLTGLVLVIFLTAGAKPESGMLSSSSAAYDGNALVLSGQVSLDHGLGRMRAEQAVLEKQEGAGKEFPFSSILLKNQVELLLTEQSSLECETASLDFIALKGLLTASGSQRVVYHDILKRKKGNAIPLTITSLQTDLFFEKHEHSNQRSDYAVKTACATGDVSIEYGSLFIVKAGIATYDKVPMESQLSQGTLQAFPSETFNICRIEHARDAIDAETIEVDLAHTAIIMKKAHGLLNTVLIPKLQQGEILFHSDQVLWDHPRNTLHLQGHVRIDESALGKLSTDRELVIIQGKTGGVSSLRSMGTTQLEFQESEETSLHHKLICHGKMAIDHEKMQATFESPTIEGQIPLERQLYYEEGTISIYANRALIDYAAEGKKLRPSSIALKGNVRIRSLDPSAPSRFGLADWITYSPTTRTFILSAHPGNKVLFFDEKENLRMSAQEVHLTHDGTSHSPIVKGVGNVNFAFSADEETLLKTIFGTPQ
jgi:lipopolysaccharide export system protein LptA